MKNNYAHTILVTITLLLFQTVLFGQDKEKPSVRKPLQYDKWITIESNANIKNASNNKPGGISTNFVLIGRQWNRRII